MPEKIPPIGQILDDTAQRDAIHIAVAPVVAAEALGPGTRVKLDDDGCALQVIGREVHIGIVDPFLTAPVRAGQRFFLFLVPGTITSLRHEWTHPAFALAPDASADILAAAYMDRYAAGLGGSWTGAKLVAHLKRWRESDDDHYNGSEVDDGDREFWHHFQRLTGIALTEWETTRFFNCKC